PPLLDQPGSTVTSGNIAPVSDGAAAVLLMNAVRARELGIPPLGRIRLCAFTGVQPADSAISAANAAARVLRQGNMTLRDVDLIEMNEPSAAEVLANERCFLERKLSQQRFGDARLFERYDRDKLNPNGGGIAIGLPPGVAGTRMIINALKEMKRRNLEIALVAMSSGNGQGGAMILER
ncbi:MAG: acetyl-CoA C-acyltransferase, partial [Calditrichaeota bacterium]|nr:acetyl-CoA C-acyltransferase [Calditrichota bacterium]